MTGVLSAGEGVAMASLMTYILILLIPVIALVLGFLEWRKNTPDSRRIAKGMLSVAGLMALVIIGFFVFTAI